MFKISTRHYVYAYICGHPRFPICAGPPQAFLPSFAARLFRFCPAAAAAGAGARRRAGSMASAWRQELPQPKGPASSFLRKRRRRDAEGSAAGSAAPALPRPRPALPPALRRLFRDVQERLSELEQESCLGEAEGQGAGLRGLYKIFPIQQPMLEMVRELAPRAGPGGALPLSIRPFSFEAPSSGRRQFVCADAATFLCKLLLTRPECRHAYELIEEDAPCRLYFDLEFSRALNPDTDGDALTRAWMALVEREVEAFPFEGAAEAAGGAEGAESGGGGGAPPPPPLKVEAYSELDSSTASKFSRHVIVHLSGGALFANNRHAGAFARHVAAKVPRDSALYVRGSAAAAPPSHNSTIAEMTTKAFRGPAGPAEGTEAAARGEGEAGGDADGADGGAEGDPQPPHPAGGPRPLPPTPYPHPHPHPHTPLRGCSPSADGPPRRRGDPPTPTPTPTPTPPTPNGPSSRTSPCTVGTARSASPSAGSAARAPSCGRSVRPPARPRGEWGARTGAPRPMARRG